MSHHSSSTRTSTPFHHARAGSRSGGSRTVLSSPRTSSISSRTSRSSAVSSWIDEVSSRSSSPSPSEWFIPGGAPSYMAMQPPHVLSPPNPFFRRPIRATSSLLLLSRATPAPLVATHRTEPCRTPDHHPTLGRSLRDDPSLPPTPVPALAVAGSRTRMEIARCATSTPFPARSAWSRPRCVPA